TPGDAVAFVHRLGPDAAILGSGRHGAIGESLRGRLTTASLPGMAEYRNLPMAWPLFPAFDHPLVPNGRGRAEPEALSRRGGVPSSAIGVGADGDPGAVDAHRPDPHAAAVTREIEDRVGRTGPYDLDGSGHGFLVRITLRGDRNDPVVPGQEAPVIRSIGGMV